MSATAPTASVPARPSSAWPAHLTERDEDGFLTSPSEQVGYAVTAEGLDVADVDDVGDWFLEQGLGRALLGAAGLRRLPTLGAAAPGAAVLLVGMGDHAGYDARARDAGAAVYVRLDQGPEALAAAVVAAASADHGRAGLFVGAPPRGEAHRDHGALPGG